MGWKCLMPAPTCRECIGRDCNLPIFKWEIIKDIIYNNLIIKHIPKNFICFG